MAFVQFPVESVREVARVLVEANLGEVTLERVATEGVPVARLSVKRAVVASSAAENIVITHEVDETPVVVTAPETPQAIVVTAPCVGIFRAAKTPIEVGARVSKRQLVGIVESLRVPNEIYAPENGVVAQLVVTDGQGVEWGQVLMEIAPEAAS